MTFTKSLAMAALIAAASATNIDAQISKQCWIRIPKGCVRKLTIPGAKVTGKSWFLDEGNAKKAVNKAACQKKLALYKAWCEKPARSCWGTTGGSCGDATRAKATKVLHTLKIKIAQ